MRAAIHRTGGRRVGGLITAATVVVGCALGAACSAGAGSANGASSGAGRPIVVAVNADATGLDPHNNGQAESQNILGLMYEQLVTLADGKNVSPLLASSYKQVSPTVYDLTIRPNVKFSNGRLMTTTDVVDSFERIMSKKEGSYLAGRMPLESVKEKDAGVVEFTLRKPYAAFLNVLADPAAVVLPMKEVKAGTLDPTKAVMGTGPYMVANHQQGNSWQLTKNPYYWQPGLPKVGKVRITVLAEEATELAALRSGTADIATLRSVLSYRQARGIPAVRAIQQDTSSYYLLVLNELGSPEFKNVDTRRGINMAVDRSKVVSVGLSGAGPVVGPAPGFAESCAVSSLPYSSPDPAKAGQLLASGGRPGKPLTLIYNTAWGADHGTVAQVVKSQLGAVGVGVNLRPLPDGEYLDKFIGGKFQMAIVSYGSGTDPYFGLVNWSPKLSGFTAKFSAPVPAIEDDLPKIASETGQARTAAINNVCAAIDADSGQIPLASLSRVVAWNTNKLDAKLFQVDHGGSALRNLPRYTTK